MAATLKIGKKEFEISDKTEKKIDTFFDKVYPVVIVGLEAILVGYAIGYSGGYKRGYAIGTLGGAAIAYSDVIEALKQLK